MISECNCYACEAGKNYSPGREWALPYEVVYKNNEDKVDMVNSPPHYKQHPSGVECIQITEHMNFNLGNAVKYIWRASLKNGIEDLKKAEWYVKREIERIEKEGNKDRDSSKD